MSVALMQYIAPGAEAHGARKFQGGIAAGYDQKREDSPKWQIEQKIIEDMLDDLPKGSWVLDVPCGTGRFFEFYHRKGFAFRGIDLSEDMLRLAEQKVVNKPSALLQAGDARKLPLHDKVVDASVVCRLTRWLSPEDCRVMLREMQRVTRQRIVLTARVRNHPHARSYELIASALDGWAIHRDEAGADLDYRIIELRPA